MAIPKRMWQVILPPLLAMGVGILQIKFPYALDGLYSMPSSRWYGITDIIQFLWGKIGGACTILIGLLALLNRVLSEKKQSGQGHSPISEVDATTGEQSSSTISHASRIFQHGTSYLKQRQNGRQP